MDNKEGWKYDENGVPIDCGSDIIYNNDGSLSGESTFCCVAGLCVKHGRYKGTVNGIPVGEERFREINLQGGGKLRIEPCDPENKQEPNITFSKDDFIDNKDGTCSVYLNNNKYFINIKDITAFEIYDFDQRKIECMSCINKSTSEVTVTVPLNSKFDGYVRFY